MRPNLSNSVTQKTFITLSWTVASLKASEAPVEEAVVRDDISGGIKEELLYLII